MDDNATLGDPFPGLRKQRRWNKQSRRSVKVWRNYYPSIAYARGDPRMVLVPIDRAAYMAGLTQMAFYCRYLYSGRLPYVVKTWFHGRKMRRKSFVPRAALLELLTREMLEAARFQYLKRNRRRIISHRTTVANLERELELRLPRSPGGNKR